jgi:DNA-binding transcriptional ArsR family regulator
MARAERAKEKPSRENIRLESPGAIRALAHAARLAVVDELYHGSERTASELAQLTNLSPSAMSYHLRALERWGIVERGEGRADARERPWRAAGRSLSVVSDRDSAAAAEVIAAGYLEHLGDELRRWRRAARDERSTWKDAGVRRSFLWLTEEEFGALASELRAVVDRYEEDRDTANHPAESRRVLCVVAVVPQAREEGGS